MNGISWSDKDIELLTDLWNSGAKVMKIARELGRTTAAVQQRIYKLSLNNRKNGAWSQVEIKFLEDNIYKMSYAELEKNLGRTTLAIRTEAFHRGLLKPRKKKQHTAKIDLGKHAKHTKFSERDPDDRDKYRDFCACLVRMKERFPKQPTGQVVDGVITAWRRGDIRVADISVNQ